MYNKYLIALIFRSIKRDLLYLPRFIYEICRGFILRQNRMRLSPDHVSTEYVIRVAHDSTIIIIEILRLCENISTSALRKLNISPGISVRSDLIIKRHCELVVNTIDLPLVSPRHLRGRYYVRVHTCVHTYACVRTRFVVAACVQATSEVRAFKGNRSTTLNDSDDNLPAPHLLRLPLFIDAADGGARG